MKARRWIISVAVLLAAAAGGSAWAGGHHHHHHHRHHGAHWGLYVGVPLGLALYGASSLYQAPPPVVVRPAPQVYIEQPTFRAPPQTYWYFCSNPQGYYPYVAQCPGGWQRVLPSPS